MMYRKDSRKFVPLVFFFFCFVCVWRIFLGKGKDLTIQSESKEVSILKLYVVLSLTLVLFPSLFIGSASFNSSLWIFIMNCLTCMNVDQLCPVDPYMMMEMFSIYIVLFGSYQSDVATEYV